MIHIAIVSPIPALRAGLRALLSADPDFVVIGVAGNFASLPELPADESVLVVTSGGLDLAGDLESNPDLAVLLISDDVKEAQILADLEHRAWGVLSPEAPAETLQMAVRALAEGLVILLPDMARRILKKPTLQNPSDEGDLQGDRLTTREIEVLVCLSQGKTNKQIARTLQISEHTVKFHVSSIYSKLGVNNRAEAVSLGARKGLVPL